MKTILIRHPRDTLKIFWAGLEYTLFWLFSNVVWGLFPLIVTLLITTMIDPTTSVIDEFRVATTILAVTLCGTHLVDDVAILDEHRRSWKWIKHCSNYIIVLGTVAMVLHVFHDKQPNGIIVSIDLINAWVLLVFLCSVFFSLLGHALKDKANTSRYGESEKLVRDELIHDADNQSEVDGITI